MTERTDRHIPEAPPSGSVDYARLKRLVADRGLLERDPRAYLAHAVTLAVVGLAVGVGVVLSRGGWWMLAWTLPAAFLFGQLGFSAHEAAHNQILRTSRRNYALGLVLFNLLLGGSRGWWARRHGLHHAQPNRLGADPDIEGGPIAVCAEQACRVPGAIRWLTRHQASAIWGLMLLASLQIHVQSAAYLSRGRVRNASAEIGLLVVHYAAYVGGLVLVAGVERGLIFVLVHQLLLGAYLGLAFLPNHMGMAVLQPDERMDFLRRQVVTARNLRAHRITDFAFGGLSCQIEHHLFPTMPRARLRQAAPIVQRFCEEHAIAYRQTGPLQAYVEVCRHLRAAALTLRGGARTAVAMVAKAGEAP